MPWRHAPLVDSVIVGVLRAIVARPGGSIVHPPKKNCLPKSPFANTPNGVPVSIPQVPLFGFTGHEFRAPIGARFHSTKVGKKQTAMERSPESIEKVDSPAKHKGTLRKPQPNGYSRHQLKMRLGASSYNKSKKSVLFQRTFEKGTVDTVPKASEGTYFTRYKRPKPVVSTTANINRRLKQLLLNEGRINAAIKFLRDIEVNQKRGLTEGPDLKSYTMLVQSYGRLNNMTSAVAWFKRMQSRGIKSDVNIYTTLIDGFMRVSDVDQAEKYFAEMISSNIQPNLVTYNCMMYHATQQLDMATTEAILDRLRSAKLKPDPYTYAILINGYARHDNVDEAWRLMQEMEKNHHKVSPVIATTIMAMHRRHNDNTGVRKLYTDFFSPSSKDTTTEQPIPSMEPTTHTHNVLLNAILAESNAQMAGQYYAHFIKTLPASKRHNSNLKISEQADLSNAYNFTSFMRAFLRHDDYSAVISVYKDMLHHHVKPTIVTYGTLMLAHAFVPDPNMCTRIHQELERTTNLRPNVVTYTILLRAWAKVGNWDMVGKVYQEMRSKDIEPNKETLSVLRRWKSNPSMPSESFQKEGISSQQ
jgi:pentatricopeptide repeat protein